jgi:hypothetical protein
MFYRKEQPHIDVEETSGRKRFQAKVLQLVLILIAVLGGLWLAQAKKPTDKSIVNRLQERAPELVQSLSITKLPGWIQSDKLHPNVLMPKDHGTIGLWYGTAISIGIALLLALTLRWWMPHRDDYDAALLTEPQANAENLGETGLARFSGVAAKFFLLVLAAMAVGTWLRMPRLDHSLWNDEEYAMRTYAHGQWVQEAKSGEWVFAPVTMTNTLHEQRNGNNHVLNSLTMRGSLGLWRSLNEKAPHEFSERALRMPSLVAGVLTILLIGFLGWETGFAWVGIGAAWLLALHPWHIRYSVEARGYSLMLLFIVMSLLALVRALRTQRTWPWVVFALAQAGYLLSFAGSIYVAVGVNLASLIMLAMQRQPKRIATLLAMNCLSAIPVLLLFLPSVPQLIGFLAHDNSPRIPASFSSVLDTLTHIASGVQVTNTGVHIGTSWETLKTQHMHETSLVGWTFAFLGGLGLILAFFEGTAVRITVCGLTLAGLIGYLHGTYSGSPNLSWYYLYMLIPLVVICPLVLMRSSTNAGVLFIVLMVAGYGWATRTPAKIMREVDRQPIRQTVQWIKNKKADALTGTFGVSDRQALSYDPKVRILKTPLDLQTLLVDAQTLKKQVFIYFCGEKESQARAKDLYDRVTKSDDFEQLTEKKGTEAMFSYTIWHNTVLK